jgi:hypothetical protein
MSGNLLGDSLEIFSFKTYNIDSLGEVSGEVEIASSLDSISTPYLVFRNVEGDFEYTQPVKQRNFKFSLPGGKYLLAGFIDSNQNGRYDPGYLKPWRLAETYAIYPDTIRIRPRFETADIEFKFR